MRKKSSAKRKGVPFLLAGIMAAAAISGGLAPRIVHAADKYVQDSDLGAHSTAAPAAWGAVPDANQYQYQKDELAAFCHFGPNTFNEVEWGEHYGDKKPDEIFRLKKDFDADTLVKSVKDAGFKKLIVTAKHHDGFCIWNSKYTDYDVAATSYKNGQGDILAEISKACTEYGLDMGLYLSPWDIHDKSYGYYDKDGKPTTADKDVLDYNDYYNNQLEEILSNKKYGNNGHFVEVWMDGAKGSGSNAQKYDFERWFNTIQKYQGKAAGYPADCMLFGANSHTTVRWIGNENGYANEENWSKSRVDKQNDTINSNEQGEYSIGFRDGNQWTVPECDGRITSGWFWGNTKKTPKSLTDLAGMYFNSVGHNATMLLNIPPNDQGTVDADILQRVNEFGDNIKETFQTNLAADAAVKATEVRGNDTAYKPSNVLDGDDNTYWTMNDNTQEGSLILDLGGVKTFDVVSIQEAIQLGQRIQSFKVEYRTGNADWKTFDQGTTIGEKRLCRKSPVKADQIKITVSSAPGKATINDAGETPAVPIISEVGVYKASPGFELAKAAPDGMEVVDISDTDTSDGAGFKFGSGWTGESGSQFVNNTNKWANTGAEFTLKFHGTQAHLIGTRDPNHGKADIYIDGKLVKTIDTNANARSLGQMIYSTDTLPDGDHTLKLVVKTKAIGIEAAYVLNNGGAGRLEIENKEYTMNEDSTLPVKINRIGGSKGEVEVLVQPNPGSAIQDDFDTTPINVKFKDGQTEAIANVKTRRNTNQTGNRYFTIELTDPTNHAIVGFQDRAKITIIDSEGLTKDKLQQKVDECSKILKEHCTSGWDELQAKIADAKAVIADAQATSEQIKNAYDALDAAKKALTYRSVYSAEDPFVFPWQDGSSSTLEAEFAILKNTGEGEEWPLQISEGNWCSNGKFVNCLNENDTITIPYKADKAGTYKVTATYRSGSSKNKLCWSEPEGKIESGEAAAGNDDSSVIKTVEFDMTVKTAGAGNLVFTGPKGDSPQLDKFDIAPKDVALNNYVITASVGGKGGTISPSGQTTVKEGSSQTYKIVPDDGYMIKDVLVDGQSVGALDSYTLENVGKDTEIKAVFAFQNYTEENPYYFPSVLNESKGLEAEHFILTNTGENENWPLQISQADWASNGAFVNAMNSGDMITLPYYADKAGVYQVTVTFRSGDPNNAFSWTEKNGKIEAGSKTVGADDEAAAVHTDTFELNVNTPGAGMLVFTASEKNAPQLDKFDIALTKETGSAEVDKTALNTAITEAEGKLADEGKYTEDTVNALKTALDSAKSVSADNAATKEQVDTALSDLNAAINNLKEIETAKPDKSALNTAIAEAQSYLSNGDKYTPDSIKALKTALDLAESVTADDAASQEQVDAACAGLKKAIADLKEAVPDVPDTPNTPDTPDTPDVPKDNVVIHKGDNNIPATEISGNFSKDAVLNINVISADQDTYKKLEAKLQDGMVNLGAYDLKITGEAKGPFTITFDVGTQYNGRKSIVYHMKDNGEIEEKEGVVKDGKVTITVDTLSPFMLSVASEKNGSQNNGSQNNGSQNNGSQNNGNPNNNAGKVPNITKPVKTGDNASAVPMLIICILAGGAAVWAIRKRKKI